MKDINKLVLFLVLIISFIFYSGFLYTQNADLAAIAGTSKDLGKKIWQEKNCIACHQIYGLGGYLGPDLTNTYSQKGSNHIKAFLRSGTQVMPNFHLSENELENLTQYLKSIDESGIGSPRKLKINYDGTIEQP